MKLLQYWRGLFLVFAALLLTGCIPNAEFKVTPQPLSAGQAATFDASASTPFLASRGNSLVSYAWDFGDGTKGSGKVATHTYAAKGEYLVQLTVKDTQGLSDTRRLKLKVGEAVGGSQAKVLVRSAQGVLLGNAEVSIGGVAANSNAEGVADLTGVPAGDQVVVVKKAGFVTQAQQLKLVAGTPAQVQVLLQPVKEVKQIADIALAQVVFARSLGAQIVLPENALVDPAGNPATGEVKLELTPWDISGDDLSAMPGNGRARTTSGEMVDLISAGMMTIDFFDAQGRHLQLAAGKKATIQMNLPYASVGGNALSEGSKIPLWHFDEALGIWIEDGEGTVVAAPGSPSGLAVKAEVSHFSTWNWDFKFGGSNTLQVNCVDSLDNPVACAVVANVTLDDGSHLIKSSWLPLAGATIINLPSSGSVKWEATTAEGMIGSATSGVSGSVTIKIAPPATQNFVRCTLPDSSYVACEVTLTGGGMGRTVSIPEDGAWVKTMWPVSSLDWEAKSLGALSADQTQWLYYSGSATSGVSGDVTIALPNQTSEPVDKLVSFRWNIWGGSAPAPVPAPSYCDINVSLYEKIDSQPSQQFKYAKVPEGQVITLNLSSATYVHMSLHGMSDTDMNSSGMVLEGWYSIDLKDYVSGSIINLSLNPPA